MAELAKTIRYEPRSGRFEIDGKEFPWYLASGGVSARSARSELTAVVIEIPCERVEIVDTPWAKPISKENSMEKKRKAA